MVYYSFKYRSRMINVRTNIKNVLFFVLIAESDNGFLTGVLSK